MYYGMSGVDGLGKSAGETLFDTGRQALWEEFQRLNPTITVAQLQSIIDRHIALYNQAKAAGASTSWLDPRFNDYQKVYTSRMTELQAQAPTTVTSPMMAPAVTGAPTVIVPTDMTAPIAITIPGAPGPVAPTAGTQAASYVAPAGPADYFPGQAAQAAPGTAAAGGGVSEYLPWVAAGLAAAFLLRRK